MSIATAKIRLDKRVTSFVTERRKLLIDGQWGRCRLGQDISCPEPRHRRGDCAGS